MKKIELFTNPFNSEEKKEYKHTSYKNIIEIYFDDLRYYNYHSVLVEYKLLLADIVVKNGKYTEETAIDFLNKISEEYYNNDLFNQ